MMQVEEKLQVCTGKSWWWRGCMRKSINKPRKWVTLCHEHPHPLKLLVLETRSRNRLGKLRILHFNVFLAILQKKCLATLFFLLKTNSSYMLILAILLFYTSFMLFNVVLTFWMLWINCITVSVLLLQMQSCISLDLVEERDWKRPDPLWKEMFWAIKPADKGTSEPSAEWKRCHKFGEWIK